MSGGQSDHWVDKYNLTSHFLTIECEPHSAIHRSERLLPHGLLFRTDTLGMLVQSCLIAAYAIRMPKRSSKRDVSQLAHHIVAVATGQAERDQPPAKNPAAVALGKLGGKKGGPARAKKLSAKRRAEIARKAAQTRWKAKKSR
jgi:hypothetical protein